MAVQRAVLFLVWKARADVSQGQLNKALQKAKLGSSRQIVRRTHKDENEEEREKKIGKE